MQYNGCAQLARLGLHWSPLLSAIVQPSKQRIILYPELKSLIHSKDVATLLALSSPSEVLAHILATFDVSEHDTPDTLYQRVHQSLTVTSPYHGLPEPSVGYCCPKCQTWSARWSKHQDQMKQKSPEHMKLMPDDFLRLYTILLYWKTDLCGYRISLQQDWEPSTTTPVMTAIVPSSSMSLFPPDSEGTLHIPQYIEEIGWLQYTAGLNMRKPEELTKLVTSPFQGVSVYDEGTINHTLEKFLVSLYRGVVIYITDADKRLSVQHPGLQEAVCYK